MAKTPFEQSSHLRWGHTQSHKSHANVSSDQFEWGYHWGPPPSHNTPPRIGIKMKMVGKSQLGVLVLVYWALVTLDTGLWIVDTTGGGKKEGDRELSSWKAATIRGHLADIDVYIDGHRGHMSVARCSTDSLPTTNGLRTGVAMRIRPRTLQCPLPCHLSGALFAISLRGFLSTFIFFPYFWFLYIWFPSRFLAFVDKSFYAWMCLCVCVCV